MDNNIFIEKFREVIDGDDTPITMETDFRQLSTWDSLTAMSVIMMIEDVYGVEMTEKDIKVCNTVEDIFDLVRTKKQA